MLLARLISWSGNSMHYISLRQIDQLITLAEKQFKLKIQNLEVLKVMPSFPFCVQLVDQRIN